MVSEIGFQQSKELAQRKFLSGVYQWMVAALAVSGTVAYLVAGNIGFQRLVFGEYAGILWPYHR